MTHFKLDDDLKQCFDSGHDSKQEVAIKQLIRNCIRHDDAMDQLTDSVVKLQKSSCTKKNDLDGIEFT